MSECSSKAHHMDQGVSDVEKQYSTKYDYVKKCGIFCCALNDVLKTVKLCLFVELKIVTVDTFGNVSTLRI